MTNLYRKKPVVIEAIQWTGDNIDEVKEFAGNDVYIGSDQEVLLIFTLEGVMNVDVNDYIIKGIAGEFYPCKPGIFDETYEIVEESSTKNLVPDEENLVPDGKLGEMFLQKLEEDLWKNGKGTKKLEI